MQVSVRDKSSDRCRKIPIIAQGINVIMTVEILAFYISLSFFMKIKKKLIRASFLYGLSCNKLFKFFPAKPQTRHGAYREIGQTAQTVKFYGFG